MGVASSVRPEGCWPVVAKLAQELVDHFVAQYLESHSGEAEQGHARARAKTRASDGWCSAD